MPSRNAPVSPCGIAFISEPVEVATILPHFVPLIGDGAGGVTSASDVLPNTHPLPVSSDGSVMGLAMAPW
jgi:hypothetical protein